MDYDGSDTQGHNLQLTGEGRSKSSSGPRPYAFPRFDFEDNLHGHLRFDSLVESEVFLGIQSQEDNQWIEDFSRGSNVIEFSSGATESCSITHRNNVWSEATSFESVELLLKSVGQEQVVHRDSVSEISNTFNELGDLTTKMESKFEHDKVDSDYMGISDANISQDELLNDTSELGSHVEGKLLHVEEITMSRVHLVQNHEGSSQMCVDTLEEECREPVTERDLVLGSESDDKNEQGVQCIVPDSVTRTEDSSSHTTVPVQDVNFNTRSLGSSNSPDQVSSQDVEGRDNLVRDDSKEQHSEMADADTSIREQCGVDDTMPTDGVPCSFSLNAECADKGIGAEAVIDVNESSIMSCTQGTPWQVEVGRDNSLTSPSVLEERQTDVLPSNRVVTDALTGNATLTDNSELHTTKLNSPSAENHSVSEPRMDSALQLDEKSSNDKASTLTENSHEVRPGGDVTGNLSPSNVINREDVNSFVKIPNVNTADVDESLGFPVSSSSAELTVDIGGSMKDLHDASPVIVDGSRFADDYKENFDDEPALHLSSVHETGDVSLDAKKEGNRKSCTEAMDKSSESFVAPAACDQRTGSSAIMESPSHDVPIVNQPQPDILGKTEPEINSFPCKRNDDHVEKENNDDMHGQSSERESLHAAKEPESGARMSIGAKSSSISSSDQVEAGLDSSCKAQFDKCHDSSASQLPDTDGKLIPAMETCTTTSGSKSQTVNSSDCSKGLEVLPTCDGSLLNKGNVAEGFLLAADPSSAACNSSTIICSDVKIPNERKQGVGGSEFVSKPLTSEDLKVKDISGDDNSFTFKVNSLPDAVEKEKDNNWTPFPIATMPKSSVVLEGVATPDVDKIQSRLPPETSGYRPGEYAHEVSKTTSGRKRRGSGKGAAKENSQTGLNGNERTPDKPSRKRGKVASVSLSPGGSLAGQYVSFQPHKEQKSKKLSTMASTPTSALPDLNTSALKNHASPSTVFQQSFTDLQQVQLRAQIFVYGSLIQGTAPDEPCMVSAFGPSDKERGVWEPVWQAAMERVRSKKSQSICESPMNTLSTGAKVPEVAGKQVSSQSKVFQSPISRAGSKANPSTVLSPIIPLSSPLWSISTPYHDVSQLSSHPRRPILDYQPAVSPLQPYQIPSVRNMVSHTTWPLQTTCSPNPWASQTPAISVNVPFVTTPVSENMKLTPVKDLSLPAPPSFVKDVPSTPLSSIGGSGAVLAGSSQVPDQTKGTLSSVLPSTDLKSRRRKKSQAFNDIPQNSLLSKSQSEPIVASPLPTPAPLPPVTTPCPVVASIADASPACSTPLLQVGRVDVGAASTCSEDTLGKVTDAKLQAEEAAVSAATAVSHCQDLWSQLAKQEPGTAQDTEVKIAAAAGAAAAAACVAKAAAAAARVASNAALQAKLMADEALAPGRMLDGAQHGNIVSNVHSVGGATPASILTGDGGNTHSSSILFAAREAAKKRIEAASAAAKQAENLDAIVKAAELAAEAVSQAGKIVAMGDPLSLKELINAGPDGYWKLSQATSKLALKSGNENKEQIRINEGKGAMVSSEENMSGPSGVKGNEVTDLVKTLPREPSNYSFENKARSVYTISESTGVCEEDLGVAKSHEVSDMIQGNGSGAASVQDEHEDLGIVQGNSIMEGSIVEVYKDNDGLKPAWFSANVLKLQDGKAFVHYTSLLSKEGHDNLKEWVALEGEGEKAPRIRPALPINGSRWQGTKKRRRSAMGSYTWTVRDMVDVSIQDSWREGIITEKNEKDETTFTVHFPARGETSAVSVQQLRPSRIWSNGTWVEWSRLRVQDHSTESDMPLEKRPRLQSPVRSSQVKNQSLAAVEPGAGKPEESKLLALTASDKVFNVGKNTKAETKPEMRRTLRTGLQKEKSRVVFGVPKPGTGKRQKFMEVSKHFPANQNKKEHETKDPVKFAKYLMPQGPASRLRKNPSRVDSKEKQAPKASTFKSRTVSNRTLPPKGKLASTTKAGEHREAPMLTEEDAEKYDAHEESISNMAGSSSRTDETADIPLSSLFASKLDGSVKKSAVNAKTELLNKRKQVPSGGELTKIDEEKATAESGEPRRSNRRFQPTHRLLEGLQSSLVIPKMSSVSNDKGQGQKSRVRSAPNRWK